MADQNTATKISLLFKDTSNDNYFSKYSSHILACVIILFIIIGLITYYKIKNELVDYKYRRDANGEILWPKNKCLPHILPIAGHISKLPGENIAGATHRNFKECVDSMVRDKNNEYINPFNEIVAASLALSGTVMAGFGFVLNSVTALVDYIKGQFGGLNNILTRMKTEIKSILKDDIFYKLSSSYKGIYNVAGTHMLYLKQKITEMVELARLEYFRYALYYLYYSLLRIAYEFGGGLNEINTFIGGNKDSETGMGYYYRIYAAAEKELKSKLTKQQALFTAYGEPLAPHIGGEDGDTTKLMDQNYTLFSTTNYSNGWNNYSGTSYVSFIQPMSKSNWKKYRNDRNNRYNRIIQKISEDIALWEKPNTFRYRDHYFTEDWWKQTLGPDEHINRRLLMSLKQIFENYYGFSYEDGAVMSPHAKNTMSLEEEWIYLPLSQQQRQHAIDNEITANTATDWPSGHNRKNHYNSIFHDGSGPNPEDSKEGHIKLHEGPEVHKEGIFIGTFNQLRQISGGPDNEVGYFAERRDMVLGLMKQQAKNSQEAMDEINKYKDNDIYGFNKLVNNCITITYTTSTIPNQINNSLKALGRNADKNDKSNQWIEVDVGNRQIHLSNVKWKWGVGDYVGGGLYPFPVQYANETDMQEHINKMGAYWPPLYFRGFNGGDFNDNPIWFSADTDFGLGQRSAFLFDRTKNKIQVRLGPKNGDSALGYYNGEVKFELQIYEFTRNGWWGNEIKLEGSLQTKTELSSLEAKCKDSLVAPGFVDYTAPNAAFCRVFGYPTVGSIGGPSGDEDAPTTNYQYISDSWSLEGIGDLDSLGPHLNPATFSFKRKYAKDPKTHKYYSMKQMEDYLEHDITPSGRQNVNKSARDSIKAIVKGLKEGASKTKHEFYVHLSEPLITDGKVGKVCNRTGGSALRNRKDNADRGPELAVIENEKNKFGKFNPDTGGGDWSECKDASCGDTVEAGYRKGWGTITFPTVWWKQTEKEDVKNAILNDQIFTTVCEPGWEFNLGPYETTHHVKIENRNRKHTCIMDNITLYSQLQFCFGIDSPIFLNNGNKVNIQDVKLGDVLCDGSIVTSTATSEVGDNEVYMMPSSSSDYPILVSNQHKVELISYSDDGLREKHFVKAETHPDAVKYENYTHNVLYCISTNTSRIIINDYVFQDWNEIGAVDYYELFNFFNNTKYFKNLNKFGIFLDYDVKEMIHTQLASGFWGKTPIRLFNKNVCNLDEIKIGDILTSGEKVLSIIKTKCDDVDIYKHKIQGKTFYGSKNISYYPNKDKNNEIVDLLLNDGPIKCKDGLPGDGENILYHFITNSGYIPINGITFAYHNHALQHILST